MLQNFLVLNSNIQGSFKKCSLLFCQPKMVFIVVWFLDHFMLESFPPMNSIGIVALVSYLHVWLTKFKSPLMFSNNYDIECHMGELLHYSF